MDLLIADASVSLANADGPPATGTPQYATDGSPVTNTPGTVWPAYWLNGLMRELMAILVAGGITPNRAVYTQLRDALMGMFAPGGSLVGAGYIKLPKIGGIAPIIQWIGYTLTPDHTTNCPSGSMWGQQSLNWPLAFPVQCTAAWPGPWVSNNGQYTFAATDGGGRIGLYVYHNTWNTAAVPISGMVLALGW